MPSGHDCPSATHAVESPAPFAPTISAATSSPAKSTPRLAGIPRHSSAARNIAGSGFRQPASSDTITHPVSPSSPRDLIVACWPDDGPLVTMPHGTPAAFRSCSSGKTSGSCGRTARDACRYHAAQPPRATARCPATRRACGRSAAPCPPGLFRRTRRTSPQPLRRSPWRARADHVSCSSRPVARIAASRSQSVLSRSKSAAV